MNVNRMDDEARQAGLLVVAYGTGEMYFRQLTNNIAIFIELERDKNYICYRIKWENKPVAGVHKLQEAKFYCRGSWKRCFNKAAGIIDFWETKILKIKKAG
jgi:hypothetical protein